MNINIKKDNPGYIAKFSHNKSFYGFAQTPIQAVEYLIENYRIGTQVRKELDNKEQGSMKSIDRKKLGIIFDSISFSSLSIKV